MPESGAIQRVRQRLAKRDEYRHQLDPFEHKRIQYTKRRCLHTKQRYVYAVNDCNNSASIVNTTQNKIVGTITGLYGPFGISISPDGGYAYVTDNNNTMSVLNTSTNAIIGNIGGFDNPWSVAFSKTGNYAYVTNYNNGTIGVVNTSTNSIIGAVKGFDNPLGIAVSPTQSYAYVTDMDQYLVTILNVSTNNPLNLTLTTVNGIGSNVLSNLKAGQIFVDRSSVPSDWNLTGTACSSGTPSNITIGINQGVTCTVSYFSATTN